MLLRRILPPHRHLIQGGRPGEHWLIAAAAAIAIAGCKDKSAGKQPAKSGQLRDAAAAAADKPRCHRVAEFASSIDLSEASGAVYVADPHAPHILVVGDSGTNGAYLELDIKSGAVTGSGRMPLGSNASDDLEGLSMRQNTVFGITSSGWMRHWRKQNTGYKLIDGPYPIAEPPSKFVCATGRQTNCARNYEGLCMTNASVTPTECAGYAASKTDGKLYCLVIDGKSGRIRVAGQRFLAISERETLTGCDFSPGGDRLWAGTNLFGGSIVYEVLGWRAEKTAKIAAVGSLGVGFPEAMALGPQGRLYRFSDTGKAPSLADMFVCE